MLSRYLAEAEGLLRGLPLAVGRAPQADAILKNALDHIYHEWGNKPAAIVSYGSNGAGYRAAEQLRQVLIELRVAPIQAQVGIPAVWAAFDEQGRLRDKGQDRAADTLLDELLWWAAALKAARAASLTAAD